MIVAGWATVVLVASLYGGPVGQGIETTCVEWCYEEQNACLVAAQDEHDHCMCRNSLQWCLRGCGARGGPVRWCPAPGAAAGAGAGEGRTWPEDAPGRAEMRRATARERPRGSTVSGGDHCLDGCRWTLEWCMAEAHSGPERGLCVHEYRECREQCMSESGEPGPSL
jgi:hypothetical protein